MACRERIGAWSGGRPRYVDIPSSVSFADRPAWFMHALNLYEHFEKYKCELCRDDVPCWRGDSELTRLLEIERRG